MASSKANMALLHGVPSLDRNTSLHYSLYVRNFNYCWLLPASCRSPFSSPMHYTTLRSLSRVLQGVATPCDALDQPFFGKPFRRDRRRRVCNLCACAYAWWGSTIGWTLWNRPRTYVASHLKQQENIISFEYIFYGTFIILIDWLIQHFEVGMWTYGVSK